MFVRFRESGSGRLYVSLVQNSRIGGRIKQEHVAALGAIDGRLLVRSLAPAEADRQRLSFRARVAFWREANERLAKLDNRIGPDVKRLRRAIHQRVPWPMKHELEQLVLLEAEHALVSAQRVYENSRAIVRESEAMVRHTEESLVVYRGLALHDVQDVVKAGERLKQVKARLG